ncbi:flagellar basal body P-ring formation chaperone FlgA [Ruegeria hyattellae]|uniref:flagellar basal body P-ring formation chaperone FlgA n=1 Tax=Ruegeria hyattellae TaxID=3233337 RepID=UPI00355AF16C
MKRSLVLVGLLAALPAQGDIVMPNRTIRAKELISPTDLVQEPGEMPGVYGHPAEVVGYEARVTLYPGRPIRAGDVVPPAIVDRNDLVSLIFAHSGLTITADGRALGRGAVGDTIRVMNLSSRTTLSGRILADGRIEVN